MLDRRIRMSGVQLIETALEKLAEGISAPPHSILARQKTLQLGGTPAPKPTDLPVPKVLTLASAS